MFMTSSLARLALAAAASAMFAFGALAQQAPPAPPAAAPGPIKIGSAADDKPQPWTVNCTSNATTGDLFCTLTQALIAKETQQRLVAASVFRSAPGAGAVMRLALPHGILLQKGADLWIDDAAPVNHAITIADANGSYADVPLDGAMVLKLQAGNALHIRVTAGSGEQVDFRLSLKGFTAAFGKL